LTPRASAGIIPALFFAVVYGAGKDLEWSRTDYGTGWVTNVTTNNIQFWETWDVFKFEKCHLGKVAPAVIPTWIAM
jgi:hypothetical protein